MAKQLRLLSELEAAEVSLVTRGANQKKRFPISKSEEEQMDAQEILKAVLETEANGEKAFAAVLEKAKLSEKGVSAAKAALRILEAFKNEIPSEVFAKLGEAAGYEYPEPKKQEKPMGEEEDEYGKPKKGAAKKSDGGSEEDVMNNEVMKAQEAALAELKKQNEEVSKALKAERDLRELAEWVAKAKADLAHFPGKSAEELGQMLKTAHDTNPELAKAQFESMKAASKMIADSAALRETGISVFKSEGQNEETAWGKIKKTADGVLQKSSDLEYSPEKAVRDVMKSARGKDLYEQYLREHPEQVSPYVQR